MEHKASFKNKAGSNTIVTHSDTKRDVSGGLSYAIPLFYSTYCINERAEKS
jgi:hypothetical protein